jgi:hypothetical protein
MEHREGGEEEVGLCALGKNLPTTRTTVLQVGEVVGLGGRGEVGETVVPVLAVCGGEERGGGVRREVGAQHMHGEVAAGVGGARSTRHGTARLLSVHYHQQLRL